MQMISHMFTIGKFLIGSIVLIVVIVLGMSYLPFEKGVKTYTVQSGSMEPKIKTGSVIFVLPQMSYDVGDIVTRTVSQNDMTITHRIIEKNEDHFITKGDANNVADPDPLHTNEIIGKVRFSIPLLGYPIAFARTAKGLIFLIIVPSLFVISDEIITIFTEISKIRKKKNLHDKSQVKRSII